MKPTPNSNRRIGVLGAGAWGTALAIQLVRNGCVATLWGRDAEHIDAMRLEQENSKYLKGVALPRELGLSHDLYQIVDDFQDLLMVIPSHSFRAVLQHIKPRLNPKARIIWATKGLELDSGEFLHEVIAEELGADFPAAIISGPSFAAELSVGQPTVMTAASNNKQLLDDTLGYFHGENLRMYSSDDVLGVEIGGAVKNVLAIATGIANGLGFGANTQAALITRGLAEMVRLGEAQGAQRETLMGVSGVGDLVLTCTDNLSRNRRMGLYLGQGMSMPQATEKIGQALEGVKTAGVLAEVAKAVGIEMPISEMVYQILYENKPTKAAVKELLSRDSRAETD